MDDFKKTVLIAAIDANLSEETVKDLTGESVYVAYKHISHIYPEQTIIDMDKLYDRCWDN